MGAMILFTAIKAQEKGLSQNKLSLPEDKLKLVKDVLIEIKLPSFFKAKVVTKGGVEGGFCDNSGKIQLNATTANYMLEFLKEGDDRKIPSTTPDKSEEETFIKKQSSTNTPSATVDTSGKLTVNLVSNSACNPKGYRTIS
jgi:hypothetical protein